MKKVFLLAGHAVVNGKGTGAFGVNGFDEAVQALKIRNDVTKGLVEKGVVVINENQSLPLPSVIKWLRSVVTPSDIVIEIHFNAGPPAAKGVESLVDDSAVKDEILLASSISKGLSLATNSPMRGNNGVKRESDSQHGRLAILSDVGCITVLVEVGFISNKSFVDSYDENYPKIISSFEKSIYDFVRIV